MADPAGAVEKHYTIIQMQGGITYELPLLLMRHIYVDEASTLPVGQRMNEAAGPRQ